MQNNFVIDQDGTFGAVKFTLVSCGPKPKHGSETGEQATTKDGQGKWDAQVLAQYKNGFGGEVAEVLKFGLTGESDPSKGIADMSPITIERLEVGFMETEDGRTIRWMRARSIAPAASAGVKPATAKPAEGKAA